MSGPVLDLRAIGKRYGYAVALAEVDLRVDAGEVVALLGDNGAGKSTLLKVMSGAHRPTEGTMHVAGREVAFASPRDAAAAGVQMVYQDLALVDAQDVATNLALGREPVRRGVLGWLGVLDKPAMRRRATRELEALGVDVGSSARSVELLSGGQRQVIALARAAVRVTDHAHGGVLLLDEPTAALGYEQSRQVKQLIQRLADRGVAIVIVTHDLPLCFEVADRIAVLSRGGKVADIATADTDTDAVVGWITGARAPMSTGASRVGAHP